MRHHCSSLENRTGISMNQGSAPDHRELSARPSAIHQGLSRGEIETLFGLPFNDLLFQVHILHRKYFDPNQE